MKHMYLLLTVISNLFFSVYATTSYAANEPVLISPQNQSNVDLCSFNNTITVNANHPSARKVYVNVFLNDPRQTVSLDARNLTAAEATQPITFVYSQPGGLNLQPNKQYLIEVKTADAAGTILGQRYFTIFTKPMADPLPTFVGLTNNATNVSLTPTIQVLPYTACGTLQQITYWIDRAPADWQGSDLQTATFTNATYSWTVPQPLLPGTEYEARVLFTTNYPWRGPLMNGFKFTTKQQALPVLISPVESTSWVLCENERKFVNNGITFNANDPNAKKATVKITNKETGKEIGTTLWPASMPIVVSFANAEQATSDHPISISIFADTTHFESLIQINTYDSVNTLLATRSYTIPTYIKRFYRVLTPEFISPANGATNVSLTPAIQVTRPVETDQACNREVIFYSYEIDRYPADWGGEDYQVQLVDNTVTSWQPPVALKPGTTYQVRVNYRNANTPFSPMSITESFTTGTPVVTNPDSTRLLWSAFNLAGPATVIDGKQWRAGSDYNISVAGTYHSFENQQVPLSPATDSARASMIRSSIWGNNFTIRSYFPGIPYYVYLYVWEDNNPQTYSITVDGTVVESSYNSGSAGTWKRLGPYTIQGKYDVANEIRFQGGDANVSGIEFYYDRKYEQAPPAVVTNLQAVALSSRKVQLTWNDNSYNESEFWLERKRISDGAHRMFVLKENTTSFTDTTAEPNTEYEYKVRAFSRVISSSGTIYTSLSAGATVQTPAESLSNAAARIGNEEGFSAEQLTAVLYPNPLRGNTLSVQLSGLTAQQEIVFNVLSLDGRKIRTETLKNTSGAIVYDLNGLTLTPGFYLLQIQMKDKVLFKKIIAE
ncbi:T9SS type A sorting domain-containing protein [Cytophagaceae bacterium DM2B3-1]|uniref:T9SS type A sorting domain-containing protein n=1 Tax=Xanthocytophaga flava TaxID=3048013 RepID=A0ABT7CNZ3_9BACT|nr:T9SS type A sorting domain-containing protein [Xanthocytophaga flavus]MDJ1494707.1 T9SS type A sorting domain-containing protein [Xanthocytophaga flavus]